MLIFPYDNIIVGILVFILGFLIHWVGQLVSLINWNFAIEKGLQEEKNTEEFTVYEKAIAAADVSIGWIYGVGSIGLIMEVSWASTLMWIPGSIFIYHSVFYWCMKRNQNKMNLRITSTSFRIVWSSLNLIVGILCILVAI